MTVIIIKSIDFNSDCPNCLIYICQKTVTGVVMFKKSHISQEKHCICLIILYQRNFGAEQGSESTQFHSPAKLDLTQLAAAWSRLKDNFVFLLKPLGQKH